MLSRLPSGADTLLTAVDFPKSMLAARRTFLVDIIEAKDLQDQAGRSDRQLDYGRLGC